MKWQLIFLDEERLRPIWRFFVSIPATFLAVFLVLQVQGFIFGKQAFPLNELWVTLLALPALLAAYKLLTAVLDGRPLSTVGLAFRGRWLRELGSGLIIGTVMILLVAALERALGVAHFTLGGAPPHRLLLWAGGVFVGGFVAATNEELVFRGYPFQRLTEAVGPIVAVALFSGMFGAAHLGNPHHTWVSTLNTALAGVPLAIAYLRTRLLWLPIGIHFSWNVVQGFCLGLPVSGLQVPYTLLRADVGGSQILTGGNYGPEGGLLATVVIVLGACYLALSKRIYISNETRALVLVPAPRPDFPGTILGLDTPSERNPTDPSNLS